jgi:aminotransferase
MLEKAVTPKTRVLMLNFPCNPPAPCWPARRRGHRDFCLRHDLLLLTDEIYAELTYDAKHVSFRDDAGTCRSARSSSRHVEGWAMTGFRIGYACAPAEISENMMKLHQYAIMSAPTTGQKAAAEALERGDEAVAAKVAE